MTGIDIDLDIYPDEASLVEALKRGDPEACACMVKQYAPRVYAVAIRMLNDPDDAEEVLQETFISACKNIQKFEERSALGTWLHRIATNAALMHLRKRKHREVSLDEPIEVQAGDDIYREIQDWTLAPDDHAMNSEVRDVLEKAISELPETLRTVFILREIEGYSTEETAQILGISISAAKVRLHRARLRLRQILTPYFT
ncbi:MAG TPA: sigma-70 family RNA polymerase sigma factor [Anaerolineae bacterium]|nr:sigma-70 family RNA polymerase sigma factor [Caldilineae bacterium]HID35722.1 sigma-70 family RNA polymerase sigma factor [Anaerolineae bacterium]